VKRRAAACTYIALISAGSLLALPAQATSTHHPREAQAMFEAFGGGECD
jgi:hypothetical protein